MITYKVNHNRNRLFKKDSHKKLVLHAQMMQLISLVIIVPAFVYKIINASFKCLHFLKFLHTKEAKISVSFKSKVWLYFIYTPRKLCL